MKFMSREFTTSEKILILILVLILLGLMYYYFVDMPVRHAIMSDQAEADTLQSELDAVQQRLSYLTGIRKNLDVVNASKGTATTTIPADQTTNLQGLYIVL